MLALVAAGAAAWSGGCLVLTHPLGIGRALTTADVAPIACPAETVPRLIHLSVDRRLFLADRDLAAGEVLRAPPRSWLPDVAPGQSFAMRVQIGAVRIDRTVVALQPGWRGETVFVRTDAGAVISIRLPNEEQRP